MRARVIISVFAAWTIGFQAFAGVAGGACRHAASAKAAATQAAQPQAAHHAHHGASQDQGQQAGGTLQSGCVCGCNCAGDCLHACQLSAAILGTPKVPVAREHDVPAVLAGHVLSSHKLPLLRPPALQA